ncbi:MAG: hypothetical protein SF162_17010 [bacterium]|nr:hypothetical protein [bacterium]
MATIHLITSILVGGQTGKSTLSLMLAAHLARPRTAPIMLVDASWDAPMYQNVRAIFSASVQKRIGGQDVIQVGDDADRLIAVKPSGKSNSPIDPANVAAMINKVRGSLNTDDDRLHIICETNLPSTVNMAIDFLAQVRGGEGREADNRLIVWTTWNTTALVDGGVYRTLGGLEPNVENADFVYVHNPYSTDAGAMASEESPAMRNCYDLPPIDKIDPRDLWHACGRHASAASNSGMPSYQEIWAAAYEEFNNQGERPVNVLPVYRESRKWRDLMLGRFNGFSLDHPSLLADGIDHECRQFFSRVFAPYFAAMIG